MLSPNLTFFSAPMVGDVTVGMDPVGCEAGRLDIVWGLGNQLDAGEDGLISVFGISVLGW